MATQLKMCIDRVLPANQMRPHQTPSHGHAMRAIQIGKLWMNGTTLRVRFLGGTAAQHEKTKTQALWWSEVANLPFDFNGASDAEIRISFDQTDGAWSYIGTDNKSIPQNQATMNLGFLDGGTAAHEFGHAIGLAHEHQNPQAGMEWNEDVVLRELAGPPNNWSPETIRHNVLNKYAVDQFKGTKFDKDSIMLYAFPGTWVKSGVGTHANHVLSSTDKSFIGGADAYPKNKPTIVNAVELKVNAQKRTTASIGNVGEEDLYKFTVAVSGTYIIDTAGPTDVVMKLFGPDSTTNLIAQDDDSGLNSNSKISISLLPGQYYVQIRHYNSETGMGNYSIKVRKNKA